VLQDEAVDPLHARRVMEFAKALVAEAKKVEGRRSGRRRRAAAWLVAPGSSVGGGLQLAAGRW
jgi:hypothetical protein